VCSAASSSVGVRGRGGGPAREGRGVSGRQVQEWQAECLEVGVEVWVISVVIIFPLTPAPETSDEGVP